MIDLRIEEFLLTWLTRDEYTDFVRNVNAQSRVLDVNYYASRNKLNLNSIINTIDWMRTGNHSKWQEIGKRQKKDSLRRTLYGTKFKLIRHGNKRKMGTI